MKKRIVSLVFALVMVFAVAGTALAAQSTVAVNFRSFVNTPKEYSPTSAGELKFVATARLYKTQDSTTPLVGSEYNQTFKVTARYSGQPTKSFGKAYRWDQVSRTIDGLDPDDSYTCQFGNTEEDYFIKGSVVITHS